MVWNVFTYNIISGFQWVNSLAIPITWPMWPILWHMCASTSPIFTKLTAIQLSGSKWYKSTILTLDVLPNIAETLTQSCYNIPGHSVSAPKCRWLLSSLCLPELLILTHYNRYNVKSFFYIGLDAFTSGHLFVLSEFTVCICNFYRIL